jgi:hypothetical protein
MLWRVSDADGRFSSVPGVTRSGETDPLKLN